MAVASRARLLVGLAWALGGCAVMTGNTVTGHDAGQDAVVARDAPEAIDAGSDAALVEDAGDDAAAEVDAGLDAALVPSDAGHDAAVVTPPVVDGVVGAAEWAVAASGTSTTPTIWAGDELRSLRAIAVGGTLYLAVEGQIESGNAMVVYIDGDAGGSHGVADLATLSDSTGALDDAISAAFTVPSTFRTDVAWGTTTMNHLVTGADATTGFRDVVVSPSSFTPLSGTQTACTALACEASISTSALGPGPAPRSIQLFARITSPNGSLSPNQTLPMDDATRPRIVSVVLSIHE